MIPDAAVEAAGEFFPPVWTSNPNYREQLVKALAAAAPYLMATILEDCAETAETDELATAAEVIYDLRRHARDLRPAGAGE